MGVSVQGDSFEGGYRRRRQALRPMAEINVTPMVDVMLVLLIIFMITAPLLAVGVPINLPKSQAPPIESSTEPLTVTINKDGKIFLQDTEIPYAELIPRLQAIAKNGYKERIFVRGDKSVDYGAVMRVMGALKGAGFDKLTLVTDVEHGQQK
jgi:biopolymer transport protein TolR